ncbi:l-lactate dehydrogenase b [Phtheirospermum japonicum]|uniref:L-lactate dehydrogenase n=1 Tax=Phtheirospermum japonicum TaxID=374723 RepID=A0A830BPW9_9LAMI|nr:l-lactate dehydrogenase b [Phtheirospermum japonicum]
MLLNCLLQKAPAYIVGVSGTGYSINYLGIGTGTSRNGSKKRESVPKPVGTGSETGYPVLYPILESVPPGTHWVLGLESLDPESEPVITGFKNLEPKPVPTGPVLGLDSTDPKRFRVWDRVPITYAHPEHTHLKSTETKGRPSARCFKSITNEEGEEKNGDPKEKEQQQNRMVWGTLGTLAHPVFMGGACNARTLGRVKAGGKSLPHAYIIGEHGDSSVALWSSISVGGVPILNFLKMQQIAYEKETLKNIHKEVVQSAYEVIRLKGYTSWAIGYSVASLAHTLLRDQRRIHPVSVLAKGFYDIDGGDVFLSLPAQLGRNGVLGVTNLHLTDEEAQQLRNSAQTILEATSIDGGWNALAGRLSGAFDVGERRGAALMML